MPIAFSIFFLPFSLIVPPRYLLLKSPKLLTLAENTNKCYKYPANFQIILVTIPLYYVIMELIYNLAMLPTRK